MKKNKMNKLLSFLPVVMLTALAVVITVLKFPQELEIMAEDGLYQRPGVAPNNIKIIGIDEQTMKELGPYTQWDRSVFADIINKLNSEGSKPKAIGIDIIFSGEKSQEGDKALVEAVRQAGNVVLASKLETDTRLVKDKNGKEYFYQGYIKEEITAFEELNNVAQPGFTSLILDSDGYVRRLYTSINSDGKTYKSFAYALAEKLSETPEKLTELPEVVEIPYVSQPDEFEKVSFSMVKNGEIKPGYFDDCIVLIGAYEEGMFDSFKVPIDRSRQMYGVECHANALWAFSQNKQIKTPPLRVEALISAIIAFAFGMVMKSFRIRNGFITLLFVVFAYPLGILFVYNLTSVKLSVLYVPMAVLIEFLAFVLIRYVQTQKKRANQMQKMLFSMADSMAEAIEGRTPYNANHTKNVARRSVEMLDYINLMHKQKRTDMHFSKNDRDRLFLASMLHDIGKMDVPLEIMDKPTKLGALESPLRSRLEIISLKLQNDKLSKAVPDETADEKIALIEEFLDRLDGFNCGRPLKDSELEFIDSFEKQSYTSQNGEVIPFLTKEESDDLHIKAGTLSDKEREIMQSHVVYTAKILKHMHFGQEFRNVREMASNHHELLNAKGYPNKIAGDKLDTMTRILTIMDIYDSLIADDRPYKKAKSVKVAFDILDEEAEAGKIDKELLEIAKEIWLNEENKGEAV